MCLAGHAGNQKGRAVRTAGRRSGALAPRADVLKGDVDRVWSGGADSACSESAVTGLSQSCCPREPLGLAAASWEARGSRARLWGGVEALLGLTVPEGEHGKVFHQERTSCQDQGKDQVVGEQKQTPGWAWEWGGRHVPTSSCPSAVPSTLLTRLRRRVVTVDRRVLKTARLPESTAVKNMLVKLGTGAPSASEILSCAQVQSPSRKLNLKR